MKSINLIKVICVGVILVIISVVLLFTGVFAPTIDIDTADSRTFTAKELSADLKQLARCIMKDNPKYFADTNVLEKMFKEAYNNIEDGMTELEFYRLINPIVVEVGCGHTNLYLSDALVENNSKKAVYFPLDVALVGDKLYIIENSEEYGVSAGDEILSINGKTSEEILTILLNNISSDGKNTAKPFYIINRHFNSRFYEYVDNSQEFVAQFHNADGEEKEIVMQGEANLAYNTTAWSLHFADFSDGNYYNSDIYEDYAVLDINVFLHEKDNEFKPFIEDFFNELEKENVSQLIIDLRGNYGGQQDMSKEILSYLVTDEAPYFAEGLSLLHKIQGYEKPIKSAKKTFKGNVIVLADGACFSTAAHFCAFVKYHGLATIIGSETAGSFVCTDGSSNEVLKYSRLNLHNSRVVYSLEVEGMSELQGVMPDVPVEKSIEDVLSNKDTVMEKAVSIIN